MKNAGVIEGFYGTPWSDTTRLDYASFLSEIGFRFYIYAPKNDSCLRRQWREPWSDDWICRMNDLASVYHHRGLEFGIGFTPAGDASAVIREAGLLTRRVAEIADAVKLDYFVLLFDDLKNNDSSRLAEYQLAITDIVLAASSAVKHHIICPSYYSTDPVLEKVFGSRPENYWEDFRRNLDPAVDVFWTGEKVCSTGYTREHLERVAEIFGRLPFLWDNYPVNDGRKMADFMYLKPFADRPGCLDELTSGHAVNPMRQSLANRLVLASLARSYQGRALSLKSEEYWRMSTRVLGPETTELLRGDSETFASLGRCALDGERLAEMSRRYRSLGTASGCEIADYIDGLYAFDPACLTG
ncbi:MAG: beta-N-acetylglucosaminidase domain-containing protein [Succinivibrionaceae bacterium]|nr:beta-N-acetylglucosaminidase domain-containing protein [Succinivibrionaceae bacterium]